MKRADTAMGRHSLACKNDKMIIAIQKLLCYIDPEDTTAKKQEVIRWKTVGTTGRNGSL